MNFTTWTTSQDAVIGTTCIRNISGDYLICRFWSLPQIHWCWISQGCYCCSFSHVWLFATPGTAAFQASLSFTISQNLLKLMSTESVMPSNLLCHPFLPMPSIFPSISINEWSALFFYSAFHSRVLVFKSIRQKWKKAGRTSWLSVDEHGQVS